MAFPILLQKLFQNDGAGTKLKPEIIPITIDGKELDAEGKIELDAPSKEDILEAAAKVTEVEVDPASPAIDTLQTAVAKVESNVGTLESQLAGKYPITGGSITGFFRIDKEDGYTLFNRSPNNGSFIEDYLPDGTLGSRLVLRSQTHSSQPGRFALDANDGTTKVSLIGDPNGSLAWNNQQIVTTGKTNFTVPVTRNITNYGTVNSVLDVKAPGYTTTLVYVSEPVEGSTYGKVVSFGASGVTIIGAGESYKTAIDELATSTAENMYVVSDSNVYLYSNANTYANKKTATFNTSGVFQAPTIQATSDIRKKTDIKQLDNCLDKLDVITPYTYNLEGDETGKRSGVIAQEVLEVLPEAVRLGEDGFYAMDYNGLTALLLGSIKELKAEVKSLKESLNGNNN